jgi:hypothetical protein
MDQRYKSDSRRNIYGMLTLLLLSSSPLSAQSKPVTEKLYSKLPLSFEENRGQVDPRFRFLSHGDGYSLLLTESEAVLALSSGKRDVDEADVVRMQLTGRRSRANIFGTEELPGKANYFIGNDPAKWHTNLPTYGKISCKGLYPGVDVIYYGNQQQLEYDFVVAPGADPKQVKLHFAGATTVKVDGDSDLVVFSRHRQLVFHKPVVYQWKHRKRESIKGRFVLLAQSNVGFAIGDYDASKQLVIDPVLAYSTYLGGSGSPSTGYSEGNAIAVDALGDAYVTGDTYSANFQTTAGAYQTSFHGSGDAFVTKLNASGTGLVYSTYLGGDNYTSGFGIAVDVAGNAYVTGSTSSTNFPVTSRAFQSGAGAGFVTKLDPTGALLVYSTYLGTTANPNAIAVDGLGHAYLTGPAGASFPVTSGAFQTVHRGGNSFVAKLDPAGTKLLYATYLGGTGLDFATAIAVDTNGNAFLGGYTFSFDFPVTAGAFQGGPNIASSFSDQQHGLRYEIEFRWFWTGLLDLPRRKHCYLDRRHCSGLW